MSGIDLNRSNAESRSITEEINALIDAALEARNRDQAPRTYLGASALGGACERAIQLDYIRANRLPGAPEPDKTFSGQTLRIFEMGHAFEDTAIGWLRAAGFVLKTENEDGYQFGFSVAGGRFKGHCDGVLIGGPEIMQYPALWEHKSLNAKSWGELVKKGLAVARPIYAAQVAIYQTYLDLTENPALFTATNKNTAEIYHELVPFDPSLAQQTSDRAVKILQATDAGELLPRGFNSSDHHICGWCAWKGFCWT